MKQPFMLVTDNQGNDYGLKKVMLIRFDDNGILCMVSIDFMESGNSNDFSPFYNKGDGEFTNIHGNLKGKIIF